MTYEVGRGGIARQGPLEELFTPSSVRKTDTEKEGTLEGLADRWSLSVSQVIGILNAQIAPAEVRIKCASSGFFFFLKQF